MASKISKISKRIYIEINSTYRNREEYPFPAKFDVNVGNSGQKLTAISALDPIALSSPIRSFNADEFDSETGTMSGVPSAPIFSAFSSSISPVGAMVESGNDEQTIITSYNSFTRQAKVDPPFSSNWANGTGFSILNLTSGTNIFFPGGPSSEGTFVGQLLYNTTEDEYRNIVAYKDRILTVDSAFSGTPEDDNYQIQSQRHTTTDNSGLAGTGTITSGDITATTITLNSSASNIDDFYNGNFIRLIEDTNRPPSGPEVTAIITDYDGATRVATVEIMDLSAFNTAAVLRYYIFPFTKDNYSFLNYVGFEANERSLYRISLNSLVLPNTLLDNPQGGRIVFYPFVYVVLSNKSIGTSSLISSNNPNSSRAVFRVPITDVPDPIVSSFVKLEGKMVNVFEFNPFEDLKFEVYLPDGTLFKTVSQDRPPPGLPNPIIQISCSIALEKI